MARLTQEERHRLVRAALNALPDDLSDRTRGLLAKDLAVMDDVDLVTFTLDTLEARVVAEDKRETV